MLAKVPLCLCIHSRPLEHLQEVFEADCSVQLRSILLHYAGHLRCEQDLVRDLKQSVDEIVPRQDSLPVVIQTSELIFKHLLQMLGCVVELFHRL